MTHLHFLLGNKGAHSYNGNMHSCQQCCKEFDSAKRLQNHKCAYCDKCQRVYSSYQKYTRHNCPNTTPANTAVTAVTTDAAVTTVTTVTTDEPSHILYSCEQCCKDFDNAKRLQNHKCAYCDKCQRVYSSYQKYTRHNCPNTTPAVTTDTAVTTVTTDEPSEIRHAVDVHEESFHGLQAEDVLNGELSIQVMDFVSRTLKLQFPDTVGMYAPSFLVALEMSRAGSRDINIPRDSTAVQIHFVNNHYLVSMQRNRRLYVYDSLYNVQHLQSLHYQLELLYGQVNINTVTYLVPQSQGRTNLCGFFAISTAETLLRNGVPGSRFLDYSLMRTHLHQCLLDAFIQQFPGYSIPRLTRTMDNIDSDRLTDSNRKSRGRSNRTVNDRLTDKERKKRGRSSRSTDQIQSDRLADKERKKRGRSSRSTDKIQSDRLADKERQKRGRSSRSTDKIQSDSLTDKERQKRGRSRRSTDKIQKDRLTNRKRMKRGRSSRSTDKLQSDRLADKGRKKRGRSSRSTDKLQKDRLTNRERMTCVRHSTDVQKSISLFNYNMRQAPEFVCTICNRCLFRNSMQKFKPDSNISTKISTNTVSPDGNQYICCTCKRYINNNKVPPQAQCNNMSIPDPPDLLADLTDFEKRLLARRYPFMKVVQLPKGRQKGIIGRVVNVPVDANEVCTSLPRTLATSGILPVKLKRKKSYTGHVTYQNIRPDKVKEAFTWLKLNNKHYQNVVESVDWDTTSKRDNEDVWQSFVEVQEQSNPHDDRQSDNTRGDAVDKQFSDSQSSDSESSEDELSLQTPATEETQFDTCIQPSDPAADVSNILSIAPGEGKTPVNMMLDPGCEEQSFPSLFPTGGYGFDAERDIKITPKKYFNARILNNKGTFAKNLEYLFFAQYITEHKQVMDSVSIAIRKSFRTLPQDQTVGASFFKDPDKLKSLILKDKAYNFLQTVRGSPPYWQKAMYKLMAAVKQFGIFTFFLTVSSADMNWPDTLNALLRQQGQQLDDEEIKNLPWEKKAALLRSNPVTTARHFDHRLQCFFHDLLLSPSQPLGKITHYSYRIEFQQRGSPHAHCVLWIENAPVLSDSVEDITEFIDRYITCQIPPQDSEPELHKLVTTVQRHHHTASCRKRGKKCRFHYPKLPSPQTLIASPLESDNPEFKAATLETAADILTDVVNILENDEDNKIMSLDDLLEASDITLEQYMYALSITKRGKTVVLQREPSEMFINPYNSTLLLAWQANLDVQYCLDPYACISYMVSYITKDEREMSTVLKNVSREMCNVDWREQLKSCANAFLNARELSAQEAVYRLLSLPLFKSNFSTVFVPADQPDKRVALLKPISAIQEMDDDDEGVFFTSVIDRYAARPDHLEGMCLAHFATTYSPENRKRVDSDDEEEEQSESSIDLKNGLGHMRKNKKACVLRYHHYSVLKQPEEYYYSQLLLFLPWTNEQNLLQLPSYKEHYDLNTQVIEQNRSEVQHHLDIITEAVEQFEELGPPVHAFDDIAPSTIQENDDNQTVVEDEELGILSPDNLMHDKQPQTDVPVASASSSSSLDIKPGTWPQNQFYHHIRNLNTEQRDTFQTVFKWCQQSVHSRKTMFQPDQLLLFISGGAGTGKSYLISAIYQMALRVFQMEGENPDDIQILLTAPTGTAAHNISGTTLHSAFLLPLGQTKSFIKLSDDKRNTLRAKLGNLQMVIVDEISMVGSNLLLQIHYRLSEIKSSTKLFGGVSVIVLGDLYQLPPVKQQFIFNPVSDPIARLHGSLWNCFTFIELTTIMRQKEDLQFAELLNRLRINSHTKDDVDLLTSRQVPESAELNDILHVYARNCDVDRYNDMQLENLNQHIETLVAIDKKPESLKNYELKHDSKFTGGLPDEVRLALGARVMLTRNLDVADGLVNGSQGKIVAFVKSGSGMTVAIAVLFDSECVGHEARLKSPHMLELQTHPNATPILRSETSFTVSRKNKNLTVARYQFPLKLAWACTIHKVQGLTVDAIAVSFEGRFGGGQAYVALSRARSLKGLHLIQFDSNKIKVNNKVLTEMSRLKSNRNMTKYYDFFSLMQDSTVVSVLNIRSFPCHKQDLLCDPVAAHSHVMVLSETWLSRNNADFTDFEADFFILRSDKTSEHGGRGGGVAIFARKTTFIQCAEIVSYSDSFLQVVTSQLKTRSNLVIYVIAVYSSPSSPNSTSGLSNEIRTHVRRIQSMDSHPSIVASGDFNQNIMGHQKPELYEALISAGFSQCVSTPTHSSGSCPDHMYLLGLTSQGTRTTPTYYSDHSWISCGVKI